MLRWFEALEISATGLTAERLRMDVIANNVANAQTTRTETGGPYRRRAVVLAAREPGPDAFAGLLGSALHSALAGGLRPEGMARPATGPAGPSGGVRVVKISEDTRPFRRHYDPSHPDAGPDGYLLLPNIDVLTEMVDLISASRAYEANVTALQAAKAMAQKALEIGR